MHWLGIVLSGVSLCVSLAAALFALRSRRHTVTLAQLLAARAVQVQAATALCEVVLLDLAAGRADDAKAKALTLQQVLASSVVLPKG